jgi:hypothetical protein
MTTTALAWVVAALLAVSALLASATSYAPQAKTLGNALSATLCIGALVAIVVAVWIGRLPADHRVLTSKAINGVFVALAALALLLAVVCG